MCACGWWKRKRAEKKQRQMHFHRFNYTMVHTLQTILCVLEQLVHFLKPKKLNIIELWIFVSIYKGQINHVSWKSKLSDSYSFAYYEKSYLMFFDRSPAGVAGSGSLSVSNLFFSSTFHLLEMEMFCQRLFVWLICTLGTFHEWVALIKKIRNFIMLHDQKVFSLF